MRETKVCTKCGEAKPLADFYKNSRAKDGLAHHCKPCHKSYARTKDAKAKAKAYRAGRKEKTKAYNAEYREKNKDRIKAQASTLAAQPEIKSRRAAYKRLWWEANKEAVYQRQRTWRQENPEKAPASSRRWAEANREAVRAIKSRRIALLRGAKEGVKVVTKEDLTFLLVSQEFLCAYCKKDISEGYTVDHIVPVVKGGKHEISNLQMTCKSCNCKKNDLDEEVFVKRMGYETPQRSHTL